MGERSCSVVLYLLLAALLFTNPKEVKSGPIRELQNSHEANRGLQRDWLITAVHYMESNPETLQELLSDKYALKEGDMLQSTDRNAVEFTWPVRNIPYLISPELASRTDDILSAMSMLSEHSCLSFHKRTTETDYLIFKTNKGCASYVGFIGGEQSLFVAPPCIIGNIVHEILHSLGFYHEHTRADRDEHITVLPHNIMTGMEKNFKIQQGNTFDIPYDITSIMHYGGGFFSANGLPTIIPKTDGKDMGQRVKMTKTDIKRLRHLYNCDAVDKETEKENRESPDNKVADSNTMIHSDGGLSTRREEKQKKKENQNQTPNTATVPASLQRLHTAAGGHNNTGHTVFN